ncbi:protein CREG1 [Dendrobium catenatum]|uniref:protein CREG1 n=1 Tax=Dendrobium catenatum TaxID=906689 RepID=UPI0009F4134D|nr:protein CREG1 [Dendrobium catenatum]
MKQSAMGYSSSSLSFFGFYAFFFLSLVLLQSPPAASARVIRLPSKPDPKDAVGTARWLAGQNFWGVLSTISSDQEGAPFGNVVSFSDGLPGNGSGIPYFYLTELDPTARDALKDARSSLTLSEYPLGTCGKRDPENPACAKLTLTGKLKLVDTSSAETEFAKNALFAKHPEMQDWPSGHDFKIFRLDIENIFLIDWFGGPKPITPAQYLENGKNEKYFPLNLLT